MELTRAEIEHLTGIIERLNQSGDAPAQKVMVTPAVATALILTTLSGLCLTGAQEQAVRRFIDSVGTTPLNSSLSELVQARQNIMNDLKNK